MPYSYSINEPNECHYYSMYLNWCIRVKNILVKNKDFFISYSFFIFFSIDPNQNEANKSATECFLGKLTSLNLNVVTTLSMLAQTTIAEETQFCKTNSYSNQWVIQQLITRISPTSQ